MELPVSGFDKKGSSTIKLSDEAFGYEFREDLIHQVVTAYLAGGRAGTKAQKTRHQVRGGGIKPWKQKGTGRARAGSINSPLWRGGGRAFAAAPRDFTQKVNKKMYIRAMSSIMSELIRQDRLIVVDALTLEKPKTAELKKQLGKLKLEKKVLIVTNGDDQNLNLASRNLIDVAVCDATRVDPVSLVGAEKVLVTVDAMKKIEERLL